MNQKWLSVALLALLPGSAWAAITAHVDPGTYVYNGQDQVLSWEVYVTDSDPSAVQHVNAFTLQVDVPEWTADGIHFIIPPRNERGWTPFDENVKYPYLFAGFPDNGPEDPSNGSDFNTVRLSGVITTNDTADVKPSGSGLGRVDVFVPKDSKFWGTYVFRPEVSMLAGTNNEVYPVTSQQASFTVLPEPASLGALALAAPLLLLRRRARTAG
jgi:hypothetical protein